MARHTFGGTISDFAATVGPTGELHAGPATLTMWDAETGGAQVTDLLLDGDPVTMIPVPIGGQIPAFEGPDEVGELWASAGGPRVRMVAEGRRGLPGVNAVPTIEAVASYLTDPVPNTFQAAVDARVEPDEQVPMTTRMFATSANRPVRVVTLGSSSTQGVGATRPELRFVDQFARALQAAYPSGVAAWEPPTLSLADAAAAPSAIPGIHVANGGAGGTTSASYISTAAESQIGTLQPQVVVHTIGANDYFFGTNPETFRTNLTAALAKVDAACTVPPLHLICSTFGRPDVAAPAYPWGEYVDVMAEVAATRPATAMYVDLAETFVAADASGPSATDPLDLVDPDTIHPSDRGHALMAQTAATALRLPPTAPSSVPVVLDRFARKVLGNAETGQAWEAQSGVQVPDGQALTVTSGGNSVVDPGFSDVEVSALVTVTALAVAGLIAKSADSATRIGLYFNGPNGRAELYRGSTLLGTSTAVPFTSGAEYLFRLRAKGDSIIAHINGVRVFNYTLDPTDAATYAAHTKHGVRCNTTTSAVRWRNFAVRRL